MQYEKGRKNSYMHMRILEVEFLVGKIARIDFWDRL